jgi:hypothetical protein
MSEQDRERVERMQAIPGATIELLIANTYGTTINAAGRTISEEAFMGLRDEMATWVGTRIQKRLDAGGKAAKVKVTVTVEFPR